MDPPSNMTPAEMEEARRFAAIAARAERRAAERAKARGSKQGAPATASMSAPTGKGFAHGVSNFGVGSFGAGYAQASGGRQQSTAGGGVSAVQRLMQTMRSDSSSGRYHAQQPKSSAGSHGRGGTGLYLDSLPADQRAKELALAKERYLGSRNGYEEKDAAAALAEGSRKRKRSGPNRQSLRFEWDADDDTSAAAGGAGKAALQDSSRSAYFRSVQNHQERDRWGMSSNHHDHGRGGASGSGASSGHRRGAQGGRDQGRDWRRDPYGDSHGSGGRDRWRDDRRDDRRGGRDWGRGRDGRDNRQDWRGGSGNRSREPRGANQAVVAASLAASTPLFGRGAMGGMDPSWGVSRQSRDASQALIEARRREAAKAEERSLKALEEERQAKRRRVEQQDLYKKKNKKEKERQENDGDGGGGDGGLVGGRFRILRPEEIAASAGQQPSVSLGGDVAAVEKAAQEQEQAGSAVASAGGKDRAAASRGATANADAGVSKLEQDEDNDEDEDEEDLAMLSARQTQVVKKRRRKAIDTRHWTEKKKEEMTARDWRIMREDYDIRVRGAGGLSVPLPLREWTEGGLDEGIMRAINEKGYEKPSAIQRQAIPIGLEGRDLVGVAETGSGKTAAFVIPMLQRLAKAPKEVRDACATDGPLALILAPVRELAQQIFAEAQELAKHNGLRAACVVGGIDIHEQASVLSKGVEVIVAAPGRLLECINKSFVVFNQCRYIVLDEADKMIDLGFGPEVEQIMDMMAGDGAVGGADDGTAAATGGASAKAGQAPMQGTRSSSSSAPSAAAKAGAGAKQEDESQPAWLNTPPHLRRTTIMFSATMPPAVEKLARSYMRQPVSVRIGDQDSGKNQRIKQTVTKVPFGRRSGKLAEALRSCPRPVIVFVNMKKTADLLARELEGHGHAVVCLHGGKTQVERELALAAFKSGEVDVMVATDVAARGLDIPGVQYVINYELPKLFDSYTHRIGRTARAGTEGAALAFWSDDDADVLPQLKAHLEGTGQKVPPDLEKAAQGAEKGGPGGK